VRNRAEDGLKRDCFLTTARNHNEIWLVISAPTRSGAFHSEVDVGQPVFPVRRAFLLCRVRKCCALRACEQRVSWRPITARCEPDHGNISSVAFNGFSQEVQPLIRLGWRTARAWS
jgi:hypothetical protein